MKTYLHRPKEILKRYKQPDKHTHKGIQGHALIIGGSYGKIGAVFILQSLFENRLISHCFIPKCGYTILQTTIPEVMVLTDNTIISNITFEIEPHRRSELVPD
jgi:NAD(P)H-hydrate repair Nnr-like enzyme with NAD(P)H-hydrate dehydratase domain